MHFKGDTNIGIDLNNSTIKSYLDKEAICSGHWRTKVFGLATWPAMVNDRKSTIKRPKGWKKRKKSSPKPKLSSDLQDGKTNWMGDPHTNKRREGPKWLPQKKLPKAIDHQKKKTRTFSLQKSRACGHTVPCQVFFFMFKVDGRAPLQGSAMPANWQSHPLMGLPKVGSTYYTQPAHQLRRGIEPRLPLLEKLQPTIPTDKHKLTT